MIHRLHPLVRMKAIEIWIYGVINVGVTPDFLRPVQKHYEKIPFFQWPKLRVAGHYWDGSA